MTFTQAGLFVLAVGGVCGLIAVIQYAFDRAGRVCEQARTVGLEDMPGHLEHVAEIGDPAADEAFGDIAQELLDDGLADVAERLGWMR